MPGTRRRAVNQDPRREREEREAERLPRCEAGRRTRAKLFVTKEGGTSDYP